MPPRVRPTAVKSVDTIASEWDAVARERSEQLVSSLDVSYHRVIVPNLLRLVTEREDSPVLDVGCGTGSLTRELGLRYGRVVGVDLSRRSVEIAESYCADLPNVSFYQSSLDLLPSSLDHTFSPMIANMVFMAAPNIESFTAALARLGANGAELVFSLTHPWFWPQYWGYSSAPWFRYEDEIFLEAEFEITFGRTDFITTHVHRPLEQYMEALWQAGFVVERLVEPAPPPDVDRDYLRQWTMPRFLLGRARLA